MNEFRRQLAESTLTFLGLPLGMTQARAFADGLTVREDGTGVHVTRTRTEHHVELFAVTA